MVFFEPADLKEVWGENFTSDIHNQQKKQEQEVERQHKKMEPFNDRFYEQNIEGFDTMLDIYENMKTSKKDKRDEKIESFSNIDFEEDNNDLILLVLLGIFIIFVLDSSIKIKLR
uniref:Uncharacterized protein n=1 Tax=viral metagenome TaxID=1070528 RepID=A0A6C0J9U3_9ZZZZ